MAAMAEGNDLPAVRAYLAAAQSADFHIDEQVGDQAKILNFELKLSSG